MKDKACSLRPSQKAVKIPKHRSASMPAKENDVYMGKAKMNSGDGADARSEGGGEVVRGQQGSLLQPPSSRLDRPAPGHLWVPEGVSQAAMQKGSRTPGRSLEVPRTRLIFQRRRWFLLA